MARQRVAYGDTSHRSRWILVSIGAVIVLVAAVTIGIVIGRGDAGENPPGGQASASPGERDGLLPRGTVVAGEGGSRTVSPGVSVGFPHTKDGAVSAATVYLVAMQSPLVRDRAKVAQLVEAIATDQYSATLKTSLNQLGDSTAQSMKDFRMEPAAGAYRVTKYTDDTAVIEIWSPFIATASDVLGGKTDTVWSRTILSLSWVGNDWKLAADDAKTDPDPDPITDRPSRQSRANALRDYEGFTEYANATE